MSVIYLCLRRNNTVIPVRTFFRYRTQADVQKKKKKKKKKKTVKKFSSFTDASLVGMDTRSDPLQPTKIFSQNRTTVKTPIREPNRINPLHQCQRNIRRTEACHNPHDLIGPLRRTRIHSLAGHFEQSSPTEEYLVMAIVLYDGHDPGK